MSHKSAILSIFVLFILCGLLAAAQNEVTLHHFRLPEGETPYGALVADAQNNLYGTTYAGGQGNCFGTGDGCGTVFELSPQPGGTWSESVIYAFQGGGNDGIFPQAGVVFDQAGNLYGTTEAGGSQNACAGGQTGCGTVFELSPPSQPGGAWTETILYRFTSGSDGARPLGSLIFDKAGNIYGTAYNGGINFAGTIWELSPNGQGAWTFTTLYEFQRLKDDGTGPTSSLVFDNAGNLYGTTEYGGIGTGLCGGCGTVFQLQPPQSPGGSWTERIIHSFGGAPDGALPNGNLIIDQGSLIGTTRGGGPNNFGAVFQIARAHNGSLVESIIYGFKGGNDGQEPFGGLIQDAGLNLYGTTGLGGSGNCFSSQGCGTVFQLVPPASPGGNWTENQLYAFQGGGDGIEPIGNVLLIDGWLVGPATQGGGTNNVCVSAVTGCGTVFAVRK